MKNLFTIPLLLWLCACAAIDPGADPFVVHSERTINYAVATVEEFWKYEYNNRTIIADEAVTKAANDLRKHFPAAVADAKRLVRLYKESRTSGGREAASLAIKVLNEAINIAYKYLPPKP